MFVPILAGTVLGVLFVLLARQLQSVSERLVIAPGLVVATLAYVGFALIAGDGRWMALETGGSVAFAVLAWLGLRHSPWWLVLGWIAHAGWDIALHLDRAQPLVGAWYPLSCIGFDLIVAGFLLSGTSNRMSR